MDRERRKGKGLAWTREEDAKLTELCEAQDKRNWTVITSEIPGRSVSACRQRWLNFLNPAIEDPPFTDEENAIIVRANQELGKNWEGIARLLPGRTANAIRHHWITTLSHPRSAPGNSQQAEILLPGESKGASDSLPLTLELNVNKRKRVRRREEVEPELTPSTTMMPTEHDKKPNTSLSLRLPGRSGDGEGSVRHNEKDK